MLRAQGVTEKDIAARFLEMEKAKVQDMSKDDLAKVITAPDFEQLPKEIQDAYLEQMLRCHIHTGFFQDFYYLSLI